MAIQSREVYNTGDPVIDRVLARIAERLDVIEGLRPDIDGLIEIESDKDISTQAVSTFSTPSDFGSMASQDSDDVSITGGAIALDKIKITVDGTVIHQFGDD
ncbi:MAG: hypothetical protein DRR04_12805 [Gammaproteobacteria bacterium]|nr:MAG: hypothetical protein DRR04_12805 [Gammaproteobacteria bacterium]RLA60191.1 MAG: hypothetical protein DRQ89_13150 [Campylobacterota bacterium]